MLLARQERTASSFTTQPLGHIHHNKAAGRVTETVNVTSEPCQSKVKSNAFRKLIEPLVVLYGVEARHFKSISEVNSVNELLTKVECSDALPRVTYTIPPFFAPLVCLHGEKCQRRVRLTKAPESADDVAGVTLLKKLREQQFLQHFQPLLARALMPTVLRAMTTMALSCLN